jgi:hypothetical protein
MTPIAESVACSCTGPLPPSRKQHLPTCQLEDALLTKVVVEAVETTQLHHDASMQSHAARTALTIWASGQYTMMCQIVTKMHSALTFTLHAAYSNN